MRRVLLLVLALGLFNVNAQYVPAELPALLNTIEHPVFKQGNFVVNKTFRDEHNQVSHAYGYQTHNGLEIEGANFSAHAKKGAIEAFHNAFISNNLLNSKAGHVFTKDDVLMSFIEANKEHFNSAKNIKAQHWQKTSDHQYEVRNGLLSEEAIRIKKTYAATESGLVPTWSMSFLLPDGSHWYYTVINATNGAVVRQFDWMLSCEIDHDHAAHAFASPSSGNSSHSSSKKGDGASYNAFPIGIESLNHGNRTIIKDPADAVASPYGWHDDNGIDGAEYTITRGNNVWARDDRDANNTGGESPDGGNGLVFDYPIVEDDPNDNLDAAITNLFVWNNFMHDVWYRYGFNEESGNFQTNSYGRSSTGDGDYVIADAQDGSGTNNANFGTPDDGQNPRMQMFMWGSSGEPVLEVFSPSSEDGTYEYSRALFGPGITRTPVRAELVMVDDGSDDPTLGCEDPFVNADDIKGKIALIERGSCTFVQKVANAEAAGAIAVIIFTDNRGVIEMQGDGPDIGIPSVMIERDLGLDLMDDLENNSFEVSLYDETGKGGRDSDLDNGVLSHEYGHGISNRLTGGAMNSNCLQNQEQMGEGWSDFFALVMTHEPGDKGSDLRGIGTYVRGQATTGGGIRPYPYTTDANASPYAYENISTLAAPHGVGAVWCAMLWDMYWGFIDEYGYDPDIYEGTGGNNMVVQLVIDGMKLQPCNPGFTDARDGIILADKLNNGGKNEKLIWEKFSRRGLGWDADGGNTNDRTDGKNGYELPPKFRGYPTIEKTAVAEVDEDQTLAYKIIISNASDKVYKDVVVTDTLPASLELDASSTDCTWEAVGNILTMNIGEMQPGTSIECNYTTLIRKGAYSVVYSENAADEVSSDWKTISTVGENLWTIQSDVKAEGTGAWFVENAATASDQSLTYEIGVVEPGTVLSFKHYYNTSDGRDGAVIEFTEDAINWFDAEYDFISNGYNTEITNNRSSAINGRAAFSGNSQEFVTSQIDLRRYEGKDVLVRFRFSSDFFGGAEGWYVDDLKVMKYVDVKNTVWASHDGNTIESAATTVIFETDGEGGLSITEPKDQTAATIYPNPANDRAFVMIDGDVENAILILSDINGKELMLQNVTGGENLLSISHLSPGSYVITIQYSGRTEHHPFIRN